MSILDDNIIEQTDYFGGFPDKNDCVYKSTTKIFKTSCENNIKALCEIFYYDCHCKYLERRKYMQYGLRISAMKTPVFSKNITQDSINFKLKIESINSLDINGPYIDQVFGVLPYKYKKDIPDILYDCISCIKEDPIKFLEMYESKTNWMNMYWCLRNFFKIDEKYNFVGL